MERTKDTKLGKAYRRALDMEGEPNLLLAILKDKDKNGTARVLELCAAFSKEIKMPDSTLALIGTIGMFGILAIREATAPATVGNDLANGFAELMEEMEIRDEMERIWERLKPGHA